MNTTKALELALEALENHEGNYKLTDAGCDRHDKAITAIKQALNTATPLAAPVQEPIGKLCVFDDADSEFGWSYDISGNAEQHRRMKELDGAMIYTTPPAQPAPVISAGPVTPEMANWGDADKTELSKVIAKHTQAAPVQGKDK